MIVTRPFRRLAQIGGITIFPSPIRKRWWTITASRGMARVAFGKGGWTIAYGGKHAGEI